MNENPKEPIIITRGKRWKRTNKNKKFLKKPKNKTARKNFFKELKQNFVKENELVGGKIFHESLLADPETCAKILDVADLSRDLDLEVIFRLLRTLASQCFVLPQVTKVDGVFAGSLGWSEQKFIESNLEYAKHELPKMLLKVALELRPKARTGSKMESYALSNLLYFFSRFVGYKRLRKILRKTENFEEFSKPDYWQHLFFESKDTGLSINAMYFLVRISEPKFTEEFIEKYVGRLREILPALQRLDFGVIQSVSKIILESEQGEFFAKLVANFPGKSKLFFAADLRLSEVKEVLTSSRRALMTCANCTKKEMSQKEFKKCSRCNIMFYCSKICQRADWPNHKKICK